LPSMILPDNKIKIINQLLWLTC